MKEIVDEFPMLQSGKIKKFRLRELAKEALEAEQAKAEQEESSLIPASVTGG